MVRGLWCKKLIFYGNVVFFFVFEAKNVKMMKFGKNIPLWLGEWGVFELKAVKNGVVNQHLEKVKI